MDNEFLPADNCSKAYMDILQTEFECIKGSLQYCSRGYYDWPDDISQVNFSQCSGIIFCPYKFNYMYLVT